MRILLSTAYFLVLSIPALVVKAIGDPLELKPGTPKGWRSRKAMAGVPREAAGRQF